MGLKDEENDDESSEEPNGQSLSRKNSHSSLCPTEDEEEDEDRKLELETPDPLVKILILTITSPDREDMLLTVLIDGKQVSKGPWFTLKEGSNYTLVFTFRITNNIVSGLQFSNTVWKTGIKVYSRKEMLGTFSPQADPYNHVMFEETAPSGLLVRGSYSVKSKFVDDDNKCYLENNYTFDIRKNWL